MIVHKELVTQRTMIGASFGRLNDYPSQQSFKSPVYNYPSDESSISPSGDHTPFKVNTLFVILCHRSTF